jgi:seryl-tRNA synthetase
MLDIFDFIVDKGGNPEKIKESQRRRYAPEEAVDEVIALYEDHRKSEYGAQIGHICRFTNSLIAQYQATQINTKINEVQKQIGAKRKVCLALITRHEPVALITVFFAGQGKCG